MAEIKSAESILESVVRKIESNTHKSETDYTNPEDGLLYCGNCHTPKQCRVTLFGKEQIKYCVCKCERIRYEREREAFLQTQCEINAKKLKASSGISGKLENCRFENYDITAENQNAYVRCKHYAECFEKMSKKNQGLLLWGNVGTGKTFSATCIANALLDRGISVIMTSFAKLLGVSKGFGIDEEMIAELNRARLLIIDDLGAERNTDFALEKVYSIIDSRYQSGLPMILTTNLDLQEMQTCTDIRYKRVYERILEVCYPVRFLGVSLRKAEAANRFREMEEFLK